MIPMLRVEVKNDRPLICARELYEALGIKTQYSVWIDRIISLGFVSGQDFYPKMNKSTGGRCSVDHYITVDMAKHICMLLRNEKGKLYRQYFLELEKAWNQPEQVMARALQLANTQIAKLQEQCTELGAGRVLPGHPPGAGRCEADQTADASGRYGTESCLSGSDHEFPLICSGHTDCKRLWVQRGFI